MILILKGANFSDHNIGTLDSWFITKAIGSGATVTSVKVAGASAGTTIPGSIKKNSALEIVLTVADGIEFTASDIVVTMGDSSITPSISGKTITISIASVTNHVDIKVNIGAVVTPPDDEIPDDNITSNYTLVHGNQYVAAHLDNTARATISPYTITVPKDVTITNKSNIKWAYYTGVNVNAMPSGSGNGTWGDYTYTGTGAAIGIAFKKTDDSVFDWNIDSKNPADYFDVSDEGLWNGTAEDTTPEPEEPSEPEGTLGDITAITLVNGNPYGTSDQQVAANRVHGETALYAPAGTVISCKDTTTYKWALRRVKSETDLTDAGDATYKPDSVWTTKVSYTTEKNGYWCFILLKASNADFDWNVDSNKVSDYFTVS